MSESAANFQVKGPIGLLVSFTYRDPSRYPIPGALAEFAESVDEQESINQELRP
jgi:hypothetical protein